MLPDRKPLDSTAFGLMIVLCMAWGLQQVTIKIAAPDVSLVMQGGIRSGRPFSSRRCSSP